MLRCFRIGFRGSARVCVGARDVYTCFGSERFVCACVWRERGLVRV